MLCLGIDITGAQARCVLLRRSGKATRIEGSWAVEAPTGGSLQEAIRASVAEACESEPDSIAANLPAAAVTHRLLHLPFSDPARLRSTIPFELEAEVPFDLDKSVVTWAVRERRTQSSTVLAGLAAAELVGSELSRLDECGLDPTVLTPASLALADAIPTDQLTLVVDARPDGAVIARDAHGIVSFHGLGNDDPTTLLAEIHWAIGAMGDETTPIVLCGDEALCAALQDRWTGRARSPSDTAANLLSGVESGAERAFALAHLALQSHPAVPNFRTGPFAYHAASEETRKQLHRTGWIAAATVLALLASWGVVVAERRSELGDLQTKIRTTAAPIVRNAPRGTEVRRIRSALDDMERRSAMLGGGSRRAATLDRLFAIHEAIPAEIPLEVVDLSIDRDRVSFRGRTDTFESVDIVTRALEAMPTFSDAEVQDVKAGVDGRIEFRASLEGAAG